MTVHPKPINLALFGLGRWGTHLLRNFLALPQANVIAVVDPNPRRLAQIGQDFSLGDAIQRYTSWQQAMTLPGLEAVVIATPASTHYPMIKVALETGLHVLSEKPMTLASAASAALCRLAKAKRRQLVVDHTYLFHPAVQAGQQLCQQRQLGPLRYAYAARTNLGPVRSDVDALWDLAIHDVAILNHWIGQFPVAVAAWGNAWLQPQAQAAFPSGLRDVGWMRLTYSSQLEAVIHVSWLNPDKQRRLALVGETGTLVFDEMAPDSLILYPGMIAKTSPPFLPNLQPPRVIPLAAVEPLGQMCRHFLACVAENIASTMSSGAMAVGLVELMAATTKAAETGQTVNL
ncbi:MAG: Gfo/Idh/MocA family protein [Nodosilinea sp.]